MSPAVLQVNSYKLKRSRSSEKYTSEVRKEERHNVHGSMKELDEFKLECSEF
jgi:hypothetical protein